MGANPCKSSGKKIKYIYDNNKSINLSTLGMKGRCNSIYTRVFAISSPFVFSVSYSFIFAGSIVRIFVCYYSYLSSYLQNEFIADFVDGEGCFTIGISKNNRQQVEEWIGRGSVKIPPFSGVSSTHPWSRYTLSS